METPATTTDETTPQADSSLIRFAAYMSIAVSVVLLVAKFWAFRITESQAVFSDAMESIVNVVAAGLAVLVVWIARKPADQDHPYGHGKIEFFSAAFEGGLIAFASVLICAEAIQALLRGHAIHTPLFGLVVTIAAGLANAALGFFLLRVGKRHNSAALEASGHHVLSDFWTSVGVAAGLILVPITGFQWIDPLVALLMGLLLARTGYKLVRRSVGGLLDEEDREILGHFLKSVGRERPSGIIQLHHVRVIRSGHFHHIDAHAVVPEFWDVSEAHEKTEQFEARLINDYPYPGELHLHVDPCRRAYCRNCDVSDCPIRLHAFEHLRQLSIEELTNPEEPAPFRANKGNPL